MSNEKNSFYINVEENYQVNCTELGKFLKENKFPCVELDIHLLMVENFFNPSWRMSDEDDNIMPLGNNDKNLTILEVVQDLYESTDMVKRIKSSKFPKHVDRILECDDDFDPIIVTVRDTIIDGAHRIAKVYLDGGSNIHTYIVDLDELEQFKIDLNDLDPDDVLQSSEYE